MLLTPVLPFLWQNKKGICFIRALEKGGKDAGALPSRKQDNVSWNRYPQKGTSSASISRGIREKKESRMGYLIRRVASYPNSSWMLLALLIYSVHGCIAADLPSFEPKLEESPLKTIAKELATGNDGEALSCPASPITTPVSLWMVWCIAIFYAFVLVLLLVWLLWRRAKRAFYVKRQARRAALSLVGSLSSSPTNSNDINTWESSSEGPLKAPPRDRSYVCVSPILEHGGMFLQQHGYRRSFMGCLVCSLVVASIAISVILPFLAGFAANSVTPSEKLTKFVPLFLYGNIHGLAPEGKTLLDQKTVASSPQCIKLRIYILAVCFVWCLAWMIVVHIWRERVKSLLLVPACLAKSTHLRMDRKLQKILLLPNKRSRNTTQSPTNGRFWGGVELLTERTDLGEPPVTSTLDKISSFPHASGRFVESSRIRLVYEETKGYFVPTAVVHEQQARAAAFTVSDAVEETQLGCLSGEPTRTAFLEILCSKMVPPEEVAYRQYADGELRLGWSIRPVYTLLVDSFLQDEFYLVTLTALWYQAFSLNNLQAIILVLLPVFELMYGVYSLSKGEQQLVGIMQRELAELDRHKMLCVRLKSEVDDSPEFTRHKEGGKYCSIVLQRTKASEIVPGDIVLLQPGDQVPCDLLLVHGSVSLDESHLNGETEPVVKTPITPPSRMVSAERCDSDLDPARVVEDEVLDPSSVSGNVGCIYAGSKIVHTSCRSDIYTVMFNDNSELTNGPTGELKGIDDPVAFLLEDNCCWGIAVRTHGETMRGQLLRQLHLPKIIRFKYHAQFPYVLLLVTLFALVLVAIQTFFTRNHVDTFRFGVEKILRMLPLYLPALWGICASLNAKRLAKGLSSTASHSRTYRARAVLPGLLPVAAKIRVVCFDKTGTLTQSALSLLGIHEVENGSFGSLVEFNPEDEEGPADSIKVESSGENSLPMTQATQSLDGALSTAMRQCLACCHSLHLTAHGMATWTRKLQAAYGDTHVFQAEELRNISEMMPKLSIADISGVDFEKQALMCSGFSLAEIASASLAQTTTPQLTRASTLWAEEVQRLKKTRQFILPRTASEVPEQQPMLEIVQSYCFDQRMGMMSVIVRECQHTGSCQGQKGYVFCKGKYEELVKACHSHSIPPDFGKFDRKYAKDGIYVVAAAYRELTPSELQVLDTQNSNIPRSEVEKNLTCLGLVLFRNELRTDAKDAVKQLSQGGIRCVMVTGDNPYTAIAVARRAGLIRPHARYLNYGEREQSLPSEPAAVSKHPTTVLLGSAVLGLHEPPLAGSIQAQRVKWTDVSTDEEIEPWRVYYTDEFKELVVTMAAAKVLMREPDTQLLPLGEAEEDIENPWRLKSKREAFREHQERVALLPQKIDWQSETPSLFDRIFFRIRIFSRMSPMGKKLVIMHFQRRGLTTCMVGDGSNDSLAIRQADVGVEMGQLQPVPFSAPFAIFHSSSEQKPLDSIQRTAGKDGVRGVVDIVRMGRCSLSTAMAIYKFHISYGLLAATSSLLVVMAQFAGMNNIAGAFLDIVVLLCLSGAMLFSLPVSGPLASRSPSTSPFGAATVLAVLSLVCGDLLALALLLFLFYGPGGFPPPCYWVVSQLQRQLQNGKKVGEIFRDKILKREQFLNEKENELNEEEKRVEVIKSVLDQKAKLLRQEEKVLESKNIAVETTGPPSEYRDSLHSVIGRPLEVKPIMHPQSSYLQTHINKRGMFLAGFQTQLAERRTSAGKPQSHPLTRQRSSFHDSFIMAAEADPFRPTAPPRQYPNAGNIALAPPSFLEVSSSTPISPSEIYSAEVCSADGHSEAALIFVWLGICSLHAAVLFISGNVFRRPAWKNRVLLPLSVLLIAFFVSIVLVPPGPMTCVFNVNCTADAAKALRSHALYPVVQFMAGDSAASTLHDATVGAPTLEVVAGKAAAELHRMNNVERTASSANLSPSHIENAAKYIKHTEQSVRHLWTDEEATTLATWFSHTLLHVLVMMCIVNTLIQFVCLNRGALAEWWRKRLSWRHRGESIPL